MRTPFSRWLPAIAHTSAAIRRWRPGAAHQVAVRSLPFITRTAGAVNRALPAVAHTPVPRRTILAATGLTVAAAVTGGHLATGPTAVPEPARSTVAEVGTAAPAGPDAPAAKAPAGAGARAGAGADQPAKAPAPKAAPSVETLIPYGTQGQQSRVALTAAQTDNARAIVDTAKRLGLPERAAVIGVATSLQESKLQNLGHLGAVNDHDSLGLFQQRPSTGWGSPDQVTDPEYASTAFYTGLRNVPDWQRLPLTQAAQAVQVSAYPFAYAQWERQAAEIVQKLWGD